MNDMAEDLRRAIRSNYILGLLTFPLVFTGFAATVGAYVFLSDAQKRGEAQAVAHCRWQVRSLWRGVFTLIAVVVLVPLLAYALAALGLNSQWALVGGRWLMKLGIIAVLALYVLRNLYGLRWLKAGQIPPRPHSWLI